MHRPFFALLITSLSALALSACRDQPIAHYRISKEAVVAAAPASGAQGGTGGATTASPHGEATPAALMWQAPPGWTSQSTTPPRRALYAFTGDNDARAELVVTEFPGDVGGELANVNRWRGQLQLGPVTAAHHAESVDRLTVGSLEIAIVDMTGGSDTAPVRLLGALVPNGASTWFFKFTGAPSVIEREKAAFRAMLQTLHPTTNDHACCDS